ncbi:imidazoleglycerol-phosphate dehydratase HisB [Kushneria sp. Sum13]|uniref:imidazoleglycerol-phosphate dehydratase HisB n=1 Tax=Kushneria sp. Sum13 TaxID=3459196 RepID=UPI004045B782
MTQSSRRASISRHTSETRISVSLDLDGQGELKADTGVPFFEHMLDQIARHGMIDLTIDADGDRHIDDHHTVEDTGITLGQAFAEALGDKRGIHRYGHAYVPLDEALSRVVIDFSGRPGLFMNAEFTRDTIGAFETQLVSEFFQGFASHARATVHIDNLKGDNAHHQVETIFKAFGRALRMAVSPDERMAGRIASTKGSL